MPGLDSKKSMARMRVVLRPLAVFLTGCWLCFSGGQEGQITVGSAPPPSQSNAQPQRTIKGAVINSVTGEPIRRALVRINGPGQSFAFTGPDGHFQLDGVPAGTYVTLSAQKPGFFDFTQMGGNSVPTTLQPGVNEALLKLSPQASIQGHIIASDGEALEGVQVQLIFEQIVNGRKEWQPREMAQTKANGNYRIENLVPGTYLIHTIMRPEFGFRFGQETDPFPQQAYPQRFYPNSPDRASAQPIELKPGDQAQADFTLSPVAAFSVSGVISPAQDGTLSIEDAEGQQNLFNLRPRSGRFRIPTLPSGSWVVTFRSDNAQGYYGEQTITVDSSNVEGVVLQLQQLASIPVSVSGNIEAGSAPVQVQLASKEGRWNNGRFMSMSPPPEGSDQHLMIRDVPSGRYTVLVQSTGGACVDSVSSGSTDLAHGDLIVNGGPQAPIHIALREDCPTLAVRVHADAGSPKGFVVLIPGVDFLEPTIVPIPDDGHFEFTRLNPGPYRVYAFSDMDGLEYGNPEALHDFAGQQVDLLANQKANVNLELNVRGSR